MSVTAVMLASALAMAGQAVQVQTYDYDSGWRTQGSSTGGYVETAPLPCGPSPCQGPVYSAPPPCGSSPCQPPAPPPCGPSPCQQGGGYQQGGYIEGGYYNYHSFWQNRGPNIPIGCPIPHPGPPTCGYEHGGGHAGVAPLPANFFWGYGGGVGPTVLDGGGGGSHVFVHGGGFAGARASASAYASARASVHVGGGGRGHGHGGGKGGCCR